MKKYLLILTLTFFSIALYAKVTLPSVLNDNMVLQQQTLVKLWGNAKANTAVVVKTSWDNQSYTTHSDNLGEWLLTVKTSAAGGPYEISFKDNEETVLKNILIGEVWFCSGQSNMEIPMKGFNREPVIGAHDVIVQAKPLTPIRLFIMDSKDGDWVRQVSKEPQKDCIGSWRENTPESVGDASAVAYFFGKYLQETLNVPVGLIISSRGGSKVEAWMSKESLTPFKEVDISHLSAKEPIDPEAPNLACVLYNSKIAPLINYPIKGFIWYQGESNSDNPVLYRQLMTVFVKDMREKWNLGEFPFYYVQIPQLNSGRKNGNTPLRPRISEAQLLNMQDIPNSGMVVALDVADSTTVHPGNKEPVGKRLAYWALAETYKLKGFEPCGPLYQSIEIIDNKIQVNFDKAQRGFWPRRAEGLKGFEIAGEDRVFYPATAETGSANSVLLVHSPDVPKPVAVRYAFSYAKEANLAGMNGIPASPFRTDNW
jgi:sialate O-acetylesterase